MFPIGGSFVRSSALRCVCLLLMIGWSQSQPDVARGPQDAAVREGDTVTFVCDLRNVGDYIIYWYYTQGVTERYLSIGREVGRSTPLSGDLISRLSIVGDEEQEEFSLMIQNVREADEGTYSCQYARASGESLVIAGTAAELTVLVPPSSSSPWCSTSISPAPGAVGQTVNLYCNSQGGKPLPNITYYRADERLAISTRTITHAYRIIAEDNGVSFTCIMTTPALDKSRSCSVMPLRILPNATILPAVPRVEEGSQVSFECYGEGVPRIAIYIWIVTNKDTGEILPPARYTLSQDGRSLEIAVMENLELLCTVSVPSGLSANATARVEVSKREGTTEIVGSQEVPGPTSQPSTSPVVPIVVVVMVLTVVVILVILIFLWRRKQQKKSKIPIDPKDGYNLRDIEDDYDEVSGSKRNGRTPGAGTAGKTEDRTLPGHTEQDKQGSGNAKRPPAHPQDIPLYSQPDKAKTRKSEDVTESEYSAVSVEEPVKDDFGLVYADLDLNTPGTATSNTGPPANPEKTIYAVIQT